MDFEHVCYGCFKEKKGPYCPYCGFSEKEEQPFAALPLGAVLAGRYIVGKVLGMGGFGITYLGFDLTLEICVAIKEYMPSGIATRTGDKYTMTVLSRHNEDTFRTGAQRFLDEARTLAKLHTIPGIVSVQNYFNENNTAYFVMDYVEGISMKEYVASVGGRISYEKTLELMLPVLNAMSRVHKNNLLHRDISPDNIFITADGGTKLLDFGAARNTDSENKSMSVILKHGYAPEEQYRTHGNQGPWSDVYAAAATMYHCITGVLPPDSIDRLHEDTLLPPTAYGAVMPPYAVTAIMTAMAIQSEYRYQSMEQFIAALGGMPAGTYAPQQASSVRTYAPPQAGQAYPPALSEQKVGFFKKFYGNKPVFWLCTAGAAVVIALAIILPITLTADKKHAEPVDTDTPQAVHTLAPSVPSAAPSSPADGPSPSPEAVYAGETVADEDMGFEMTVLDGYTSEKHQNGGLYFSGTDYEMLLSYRDTDGVGGALYDMEDAYQRIMNGDFGIDRYTGFTGIMLSDAADTEVNGVPAKSIPYTAYNGSVPGSGELIVSGHPNVFGCYLSVYFVADTANNADAIRSQCSLMCRSLKVTGDPELLYDLDLIKSDDMGIRLLMDMDYCAGGYEDMGGTIAFYPVDGAKDQCWVYVEHTDISMGSTFDEIFQSYYDGFRTQLPDADVTMGETAEAYTGRAESMETSYTITQSDSSYSVLVQVMNFNGTYWTIAAFAATEEQASAVYAPYLLSTWSLDLMAG